MSATIANGCNQPITFAQGTVPDVSGALQNYFQLLTFTKVDKQAIGYQAVETPTAINFWGTIQPFSERQLMMRPEGERAWSHWRVLSQYVLPLQVDDVIVWNNVQYRVLSLKDFSIYGYFESSIVEDYKNSGPPTP